ncbi:hypothetical protein CW740_06665 [Kangiella profundi]|uniref:Uncharacterized protein n=1 Tax=Kangiella profundi TaxID=1561924 RepID=A0A2K9ABZ5_9GAMM|nr:hypothetical protein [Kangiella profundi]AUD78947.1 hypothetical protein CW740_06665 [Kangiella profundi]GGF02771.1 hypothetical protein GCM10011356_15590 [Kangiella profundi]
MNIYLACALTHVPECSFKEYSNLLVNVAEHLTASGHRVKYALANSDPQLASYEESCKAELCYKWDRDMVLWSDLIIAEASFPSTGMGIELQLADSNGIPIVMCFKPDENNKAKPKKYRGIDHIDHNLQIGDGYISLMALGLPSLHKVIKYNSILELLKQLDDIDMNLTNDITRRQQSYFGI